MNALPRRLAALGAPAVLLVSLTACGGGPGGDAPEDASVEEFCTAYAKSVNLANGEDIKNWAEDMADVGTPEDLSDEQRKGFEVLVDTAADVDEDADLSDLEDEEVSGDDKDAVESLTTYVTGNCSDQISEALGVEAPDLPDPAAPDLSDLPEVPTPS
ncbi:hypothetical protein GCM10023340_01370 [Nocardioides marinquilinus]|uniref:Lipoprotein n=1 Tax=Nocardioides marinquilinus TaxID=1210400 RepID=A0ABP9P4Y9_9ACTN